MGDGTSLLTGHVFPQFRTPLKHIDGGGVELEWGAYVVCQVILKVSSDYPGASRKYQLNT